MNERDDENPRTEGGAPHLRSAAFDQVDDDHDDDDDAPGQDRLLARVCALNLRLDRGKYVLFICWWTIKETS